MPTVVPSEFLHALAAEAPANPPRRERNGHHGGQRNGEPFDIDAFLERHGLEVDGPEPWQRGRRWILRESPLCEHHDGAAFIVQHPSGALSAGCHHDGCTWGWKELREALEPAARRPARTRKRRSLSGGAETEGAVSGLTRALTDLGNAERFVAQHGDKVRFVATWGKWLIWDDARWKLDETGEVQRLAKKTVRSIHQEANQLASGPDADANELAALIAWGKASEKRDRINALIALAATEAAVAIHHEALDADPWLLNCRNGTVDLRIGKLRPHDPHDLLTKSTGINYPTTRVATPQWNKFLRSTFSRNFDLIGFVKLLVGYSATGVIEEHILPILWGRGSNGKSTFVNAILHTLGDYAVQAPRGLLAAKRQESHPTELTVLFGARFVSITETPDNQRLDEGLVKSLTGGDPISARRMKEDFWEFRPTHTPFLSTNHKPLIRGTDHGIWRRVLLVPFTVTFVDPAEAREHPGCPRKDKKLEAKLQAEAGGILRWIVSGCVEWQRDGLVAPEAVLGATRDYRSDSDTIASWLADRCTTAADATARAGSAYDDYRSWCEATGEKPLKRTEFRERLADAGYEQLPRRRDGVHYTGFCLRALAR